jgi:hypothetical protein
MEKIMNTNEKSIIRKMRLGGNSYSQIAVSLQTP